MLLKETDKCKFIILYVTISTRSLLLIIIVWSRKRQNWLTLSDHLIVLSSTLRLERELRRQREANPHPIVLRALECYEYDGYE